MTKSNIQTPRGSGIFYQPLRASGIFCWKKWFFVATTAFIAVTFLYALPQWFLQKAQVLEIPRSPRAIRF